MKLVIVRLWLLTVASCLTFFARPETGVSEKAIVLGQSIALTGVMGELGKEYLAGAQIYFSNVNDLGGVAGRKVTLVSLDDKYDEPTAIENTGRLVGQESVFAIFGQFGTGITLGSLPLTTKVGIPLFAPYTGADALRDSENRYLFHIRASYGAEAEKLIQHLVTTGVTKIAVIHQNDPFGRAGLEVANAALSKHGLKPVAIGAIDVTPAVQVGKAVSLVSKAQPMAILMIAAGKGAVAFIKEYQRTGEFTQFLGLSVVSSHQLIQEVGASAHGVVISQVMPSPWRSIYPVVREYQRLFPREKGKNYSYASLEGFIAAKVIVEALKRTGKELTRERFITALESLRNYDVGGLTLEYGPKKRSGSTYVDLTIVGRNGSFVR